MVNNIKVEYTRNLLYEGYIKRFKDGILFESFSNTPLVIIDFYLSNKNKSNEFSKLIYEDFKTKYILSENLTEGIEVTLEEVTSVVRNRAGSYHVKEEVKGLADVYDFIKEFPFEKNANFNAYILLHIHNLLFKYTPFNTASGKFRESNTRILGSIIELEDYTLISKRFTEIYRKFNDILRLSENIELYIRSCIKLHAELIQIHPFFDGNGRSCRALNNLLMSYVGLPPTYVKLEEKTKYCEALEKAILKGDSSTLEQFFFYKIANAIIENNPNFSQEALAIL